MVVAVSCCRRRRSFRRMRRSRADKLRSGGSGFSLTFRDPNDAGVGVNQARADAGALSSTQSSAASACLPSALALVGFSPGHHDGPASWGCAARSTPAAIVGYSGLLVVPPDGDLEKFAAEIKARPPVLLVHGDQDDLIPPQALFQAAQGLAALDVPVRMAYVRRCRSWCICVAFLNRRRTRMHSCLFQYSPADDRFPACSPRGLRHVRASSSGRL